MTQIGNPVREIEIIPREDPVPREIEVPERETNPVPLPVPEPEKVPA